MQSAQKRLMLLDVKLVGIDTDDDCVKAYNRVRALIATLDAVRERPVGPERAAYISENNIRITEVLEDLFAETGTLLSLYRQRFESASDLDE